MSGAGHGHGHGCAADHHRGEYTERQRADLDMVLAFNHRLAAAIDDNIDVTDTVAALDPDPLRYMWVDEGDGQIPAQLAKAAAVLDAAPRLAGQMRGRPRGPFRDSRNASRPTIAARGATTVIAWLEWQEDRGDRLVAEVNQTAAVVVPGPEDLFRPTAAVTADGVPWLALRPVRSAARSGCGPAASSTAGGATRSRSATPTARRSTRRSPPPTTAACTCAGRAGPAAGSPSSPGGGDGSGWEADGPGERRGVRATSGTRASRSSTARTGVAYAWTEYVDGSYAVAVRRIDAHGGAGPVRRLTGGSDYALHPSLATTTDGRLWCAFDVVSVQGHGGSGPTRLRPAARGTAAADDQDGMREPGASVPPELLPEVSAHIRVVGVDGDGLVEPPGELARGLNVVPSALPRLQATADGGLVVAYRIHRQLPLMTLLLGGGRPGARPRRLGRADHVRRHRRHARGGVAGRGRRPACCWPPSPTAAWNAPCTGPRGSAAASAPTSPITTAP